MSDGRAVVYLEADDEVTSVVRRVRESDGASVIVVAPGRSRATSSVVALRLLARAAEAAGREVAVVGDALTRSLAAEAGLTAYGTLDEARRAGEATPVVAPVQAPIRIVRGVETTDVGPIVSAEEATVPVQVVAAAAAMPRRSRVRSRGAAAAVLALVALLVLSLVAGAALLPAATVTIEPATVEVGPVPDVIEVADAERLSGTAEATVTVTATDRYEELRPARGEIVFLNWTFFDQRVEAGTLVAAGLQAFETVEDVVVGRGRLTAEGTIQAGEGSVEVVAAAPGPDANVDAGAIDVILDSSVDARLRGFPENERPRVSNPDPTQGGADESGPRISEADVEEAVEALTAELREQVADELAAIDDRVVIQPGLAEPEIAGIEGLVGTRDEPEVEIGGTLSWEAFAAEPDAVTEEAKSRFLAESRAPDGHEVLPESVVVEVQEGNVEAGRLRVDVTVTARAAPRIDRGAVFARIVGRTQEEAQAALADLGRATVELWPGWVASVPDADWRLELRVVSP